MWTAGKGATTRETQRYRTVGREIFCMNLREYSAIQRKRRTRPTTTTRGWRTSVASLGSREGWKAQKGSHGPE